MINEYSFYLSVEKNFSEHTLKSYIRCLDTYVEFLNIHNLRITTVVSSDLKLYITELYNLKYAKKSICLHISVLKSFYKFIEQKHKYANPTTSLVYPKLDKKLPHFLFFSEMDELLNELEKGELRVYLLFIFTYATGIRLSELSNVEISDIYNNELRVIGKGNKERIVPISEYVVSLVEEYVLTREYHCNYLFLNSRGNKLTARGISYIMNKEMDKLAFNFKVTPHTLRHTFASHLLTNGMDIKIIQEILGHSSLQSTQVYTHVTKGELLDTYNQVAQRIEDE